MNSLRPPLRVVPNKPNQTKQTNKQTNKPNQTKPNQTKPNQTKPNQTKPNQTKPNQTKPNQTKPNKQPNQTKQTTKPNQTKPNKQKRYTNSSFFVAVMHGGVLVLNLGYDEFEMCNFVHNICKITKILSNLFPFFLL
jgi:hypothetical protein